jgi:glycosyltransferase involved in cell wall biosynthesis
MPGDKEVLLFRRDFGGLTGGHLKVWHYFRHALQSARFTPRIHLAAGSAIDADNPWRGVDPPPLEEWRPDEAGALFVAGLDWEAVPESMALPVINLIQHVRHADRGDPRRPFLARPAVRICVSGEVADAIAATGIVNGPIHVIPNGIDLGNIPSSADRDIEVLIAGLKHPAFAAAVAARLEAAGVAVEVLDAMLPREVFLARLSRARVAVTLPNETEGFFLPALEAMAAGAIVVCPDCVGNRAFCRDGVTCLRPPYTSEGVVTAALAAVRLDDGAAASLRRNAAEEAGRHGLEGERLAFLRVLDAV